MAEQDGACGDARRDCPPVTLIAGATASGKSALALRMAAERGGIIVNADSMQVYADLRILTARPPAEDEVRVPHRLYGHVPADEAYSVARWLADVQAVIGAARALGRPVFIVGGTGLYFKALTEGLSPIPPIPDDIRNYWRAEGSVRGAEALFAELSRRDPETAARLHSSDTQRIVRALEVFEATGRPLADWQGEKGRAIVDVEQTERLLVSLPREDIYARCDARLEGMVKAGAIEEVARLADKALDPALPVMRAVGVGPLMAHVRGECALSDAVEAAQRETRNYVKRQITWQRRYMIAWNRV